MNVLGIHDGKDAGVCLLSNGQTVYAANEERFSRRKLHFGFPWLSLHDLLETTGIRANEIDRVSVGFEAMVEPEDYPIYTDIDDTTLFQRIFAGATRFLGPVAASRTFVQASRQVLGFISKNKQGLQQAQFSCWAPGSPTWAMGHLTSEAALEVSRGSARLGK